MELIERRLVGGPTPGGDDAAGGGDALAGMRAVAERLAAAGDRAMNRALSQNSQEYLAQRRQRGGQ